MSNNKYTQEQWERLFHDISNGNENAYMFLCAWSKYCHGIDDIVDKDISDAESIVGVFFTCTAIYSSAFWQAYSVQLFNVVALVSNDYVDSNDESIKDKDSLRFSGNYMLLAVANICGGYQHMRKFSRLLREIAYKEHHNDKGEPI